MKTLQFQETIALEIAVEKNARKALISVEGLS